MRLRLSAWRHPICPLPPLAQHDARDKLPRPPIPFTRDMKQEPIALLRKYAEGMDLRLSSDNRLTPHFHAMILSSNRAKAGPTEGTVYLVHHDGGRSAILMLSLA